MKLTPKYSLEKDLETYTALLEEEDHKYAYGQKNVTENRIKMLPQEAQDIFHSDKNREEKTKDLKEYLEGWYEERKDKVDRSIKGLENLWEIVGPQILYRFEDFYGKPFPFEEVTAYVSSNVYYAYSVKQRYFYMPLAYNKIQLQTTKHELCHFMFHHYYADLEERIGGEKFQLIKESFTFFTSPEGPGYPGEKELRELYLSKKWSGPDEIIEAAVELLNS